jgi:hypothetical protein
MAEIVKRSARVGFADILVALRYTVKQVTGAYALPTEAQIAKAVIRIPRITFGYSPM